uniref:Uncharacterized protein n=1 Tax=Anguilla anguilla TaxID=7936 RepID=A0A0E9Q7G3_ANGAN
MVKRAASVESFVNVISDFMIT